MSSIDEVLNEARGRLERLTPHEAAEAMLGGALLPVVDWAATSSG